MAVNMEGNATQESPATETKKAKGDRLEIVKVLVLALVSFLAGFALVLIFLRGPSDSGGDAANGTADAPAAPVPAASPAPAPSAAVATPAPTEAPIAQPIEAPAAAGGYEPAPTAAATGGYEPTPAVSPTAETGVAPSEGDAVAATATAGADEGSAPAEVPPGKTPDGMALDGEAFYLKCWDDGGVERKGVECDRLGVFEKRFATRLYVVDKCRIDAASVTAEGKLSVAAEVDFAASKVSFWNAPSSDIQNAAQIGSCLRGALTGLPIQGIEHKYARYRVFFTVLFGKQAAKKAAAEAVKAEPAADKGEGKAQAASGSPSKPPAGKGKLITVVKDKVRVRKTPVDGEVIGKIGQGNQVRLLKQKDGWCQIVTPSGNEGWMICDALGL
jgi:hypothetical protein